jgi:hypothetical protein
VLVVVLVVNGVPAPVMHVVDVIPVWDRNMAASFTVNMIMSLVYRVAGWLAFVVVIPVLSMKVTVVHVVDMIPVWDRDVTASFAMQMVMFEVFVVDCGRHDSSLPVPDLTRWRLAGREYSPASLPARESPENSLARMRGTWRSAAAAVACRYLN